MLFLLLSTPAMDSAGVSPQIAGMDSILDVARLLVPLFLTVGGGVILGRLFVLSEDTLVRVLTDLVTSLIMIKSPIMWAMAAGFIFNLGKLTVPDFVLETCEFGGSAMSSLAAITLGRSISRQKFHLDVNLLWGLLLRTGVGFFAGVAGALAFGLAGLERTVFIVGSALPSAVFSYVITKRYGADTEFSSAMVVASTVLGMVTIPLIFWASRFFV